MNENEFNYYHLLDYHTFNNNCFYKGSDPCKLISTKDGEIHLQPMWRAEQLAKFYGVDIHEYDDKTNWEYYNEVMWQLQSEEEREEFRQENLHQDRFDEYFEEVAKVAAEVGAERTEIKCLIKSLMLKYRLNRMESIHDFPHEAFSKLYNRLVSSEDIEQILVAERLARHHVRELEIYVWCDISSKKSRAGWVDKNEAPFDIW